MLIAFDDRTGVQTAAILVEVSVIGVIAEANGDAICGSQLAAIDIIFAIYAHPDVGGHVRPAALQQFSRPLESSQKWAPADAQRPVGQVIGARRHYVVG